MGSGRVADLGAGWGFLSEHILRVCPAVRVLELYDADKAALEYLALCGAVPITELLRKNEPSRMG